MNRYFFVSFVLVFCGCSSSNGGGGGDSGSPGDDGAGGDTSVADSVSPGVDTGQDTGSQDTGSQHDTGSADSTTNDGAQSDTGTSDTGTGDSAIADAGCPSSWLVAPTVDPSIALPDGGGVVILHAAATGTQDYLCAATTTDAGTTYAWKLTGPDAVLDDCANTLIGHHFPSEGGAAAPEWQTTDGTYVVGRKVNAFDASSASVPWLILQRVDGGGTGTLSNALYIQRVNTEGGVPDPTTCNPDAAATTVNVGYGADYYFFGQ